MIKDTGVPFDAEGLVEGFHEIGNRPKTVIGYLVDGNFVTVGRLEHYLRVVDGKEIEILS